jgi:hypothetical protein
MVTLTCAGLVHDVDICGMLVELVVRTHDSLRGQITFIIRSSE